MRSLEQIGRSPEPGDIFIRDGRTFEVIDIQDGLVMYRTERVRLRRPSAMTLGSWRALATDHLTTTYQ